MSADISLRKSLLQQPVRPSFEQVADAVTRLHTLMWADYSLHLASRLRKKLQPDSQFFDTLSFLSLLAGLVSVRNWNQRQVETVLRMGCFLGDEVHPRFHLLDQINRHTQGRYLELVSFLRRSFNNKK